MTTGSALPLWKWTSSGIRADDMKIPEFEVFARKQAKAASNEERAVRQCPSCDVM